MAKRENYTKGDVSLLGLGMGPVEDILDTPEKVRQLHEEVKQQVEPELQKLDRASSESQAKATRYTIK